MAKKLMEHAGGKKFDGFWNGKKQCEDLCANPVRESDFSDVAGEDEAKENLSEIVDYLHNPKKYTDVGASMPKRCPSCRTSWEPAKQMLAKAVAGESNVPFFLNVRFRIR